MNAPAARLMRRLLQLATESGAGEMRLVADAQPALSIDGQWRAVPMAPLSPIAVLAVHDECLYIANRPDLRGHQDSTYRFEWPPLGRWEGRVAFPGISVTLHLRRLGDDEQVAEAAAVKTLPPLTGTGGA